MSFETVELTRVERVGILRLNRPQVRNAMNAKMVAEIAAATAELANDDSTRCVVITGVGSSLCSGLDLKEHWPNDINELYLRGLGDREAVYRLRKPVIAAVAGAAIGAGCELALMCDIILADASARFSQPEVIHSAMPGAGGTQRLAKLVGRMRAMEIALSGRTVEAEEAHRIGLVLELTASGQLQDRALEMARSIARAPAVVSMMIKQAISLTDEIGLTPGLQFERALCYSNMATRLSTDSF